MKPSEHNSPISDKPQQPVTPPPYTKNTSATPPPIPNVQGPAVPPPPSLVKEAPSAPSSSGMSKWGLVTISGVAGIMLGGGSMYAADQLLIHPHNEVQDKDALAESGFRALNSESQQLMADVDDNQSFGEAYASARSQVGAGGAFQWHGHTYSTYTPAEFRDLSEEELDQYTEMVEAEREAEVEVFGVGNAMLEDGREVTIGQMTLDGQDVVVIDMDHDGMFDVMAVDINGNGDLDEGELFDITDEMLTVNDVEEMSGAESPGFSLMYDDGTVDGVTDSDDAVGMLAMNEGNEAEAVVAETVETEAVEADTVEAEAVEASTVETEAVETETVEKDISVAAAEPSVPAEDAVEASPADDPSLMGSHDYTEPEVPLTDDYAGDLGDLGI